ncbi:hypothetical protein D7D52_34810 [Nocardia yunnanensis]|uniref:Uncharacterized protein n=1 Tax=Nocardia yunnanensis TaxID=2382165 RepID=A0A386ZLH8_9NOCA|nr:hypothetical protein [Nocardia yunnanensis]AYF78143.1 hypothetical protein D7D52_34810 [Nocardia yunnanensis]
MPFTRNARGRRILAAVALALTVAALAACSRGHEDFGEHDDHGTGVPSGATVATLPPLPAPWADLNRDNPEAVALAAVAALFDWRPADGDTGPESARDRARPLLTPRAADSYRPYQIPRPLWESWMNTRATITASSAISSEQHPADTEVSWQRKITTHVRGPEAGDLTATTLITVTKQPVWTVTAVTTLPS